MDDSPYQPPGARLLAEHETVPMFYVVSVRKFWLLTTATFGLYSVYWFYRHWRAYRIHGGSRLWPIPRAIFAIFFTHELFRTFRKACADKGVTNTPSLDGWATLFVVATIIDRIVDQLSRADTPHPVILGMSLVGFLVCGWPLYLAQQVANAACDDPEGSSNARLGLANGIWILLGVGWWGLVALGLWLIYGGVPFWL
jgi:hypothetical protein